MWQWSNITTDRMAAMLIQPLTGWYFKCCIVLRRRCQQSYLAVDFSSNVKRRYVTVWRLLRRHCSGFY